MANSRKPQAPPLNPDIIEKAPLEPSAQGARAYLSGQATMALADLAARLEEAEAENERLRGKQTVDEVKAGMMKPYADRVYWFVVGYCAVVAVILVFSGFRVGGFGLSDTTLGIIAGSTAVSVIGLIGIVVSGLFGTGRLKKER